MPVEPSGAQPGGTWTQLFSLNSHARQRRLTLESPLRGPVDLDEVIENHVQGVTRIDEENCATLIVSVSGSRLGSLWFARFELVADRARPGQRCLAKQGKTVAMLRTTTDHPGGIQASGGLLAVASEAATGWARIDLYDVEDPAHPALRDTLMLNNGHGEGVSQLTGSKAGFVAFSQIAADEYFLFVGGRSYARKEGWFYRYTPRAAKPWHFEGNFTGNPVSSSAHAWGPQNGAALVRSGDEQAPRLVTFGSKGSDGFDAFRTRVRCFAIDRPAGQGARLVQEPTDDPKSLTLASMAPEKLGPNQRWGSTAFADASGLLHVYLTARNARPRAPDFVHELEIAELTMAPDRAIG